MNKSINLRGSLSVVAIVFAATCASSILGQCPKPGLVPFKTVFGAFQSLAIAVPDLNGDGKPDLAVYEDPAKTKIYLGLGGGDFASPVTYNTVGVGWHADFGDLNGDGRPEMLANQGNGSFQVWMNNGTGSFTLTNIVPHQGVDFIITDLNADGKGDLISWQDSLRFIVRLGNGAGGFTSGVVYSPGSNPFFLTRVLVGDYNGDGKLDVAAALQTSSVPPSVKLGLYLNDGTGAMVLNSTNPVGAVELKSAADLNGDGKFDLTGVTPSANTVTILLNGGSGTFTPHAYSVNPNPVNTSISDFDGDGKKDVVVLYPIRLSGYPGRTILFSDGTGGVVNQSHVSKPSFGPSFAEPLGADFNNDGKIEYLDSQRNAWSRESTYYIRQTTCNAPGDPRRIDYDGDGWTEFALYRPSNGNWYRFVLDLHTPSAPYQFGANGDVPTPGDYDGDGKSDLAVFRPTNATWYVLRSSDQTILAQPFGLNADKPVPGDYDGDGRTDIAVYRPSSGAWRLLYSSDNLVHGVVFGISTDLPVPTDFDGDNKTDVAVFRPSDGWWYLIKSATNTFAYQQWGSAGDRPVAADYDGDGRSDIAIFRPGNGFWYVLRSYNSALLAMQFGTAGDIPIPGFVRDDETYLSGIAAVPTVYRPSTGSFYFGTPRGDYQHFDTAGYVPVSGPYLVQ